MTNENRIKLGYEIDSGKEVDVPYSHLIVTGVTQLSGKTTTLEALIKRSGSKAIVFKTKIGERSFTQGTEIAPFFRDRVDYEFVKSMIEAYAKEKIFLEKGTLMQLCKGSSSLLDIKRKVDEQLATTKLRGLKEEIYVRLQHYLENLIPQIQYANLSQTLTVYDGINIMNLERFSEEAQSLIIESVAGEVLKTMHDIIFVIPEAWKFIPQKYNNPCKRSVESFIRQGATNKNFIWLDSQDMAGVDKIPLKQISTWILGYQSERNEVKHTLDQIPIPAKQKPKEEDIMKLKRGQFYVSTYEQVKKIYVQPVWLDDETAIDIAKGKKSIDEVKVPENLVPFAVAPAQGNKPSLELRFDDSKIRKEVTDMRIDFFNKIQELQTFIQKIAEKQYSMESKGSQINEDEIIAKVLQKMPTSNGTQINTEAIITEIIKRIPRGTGTTTYEVAPLEKIKKDFLDEAKNEILGKIGKLNPRQKKMLKYVEAQDKGLNVSVILEKCLFVSPSGGSREPVTTELKEMGGSEIIRIDEGHKLYYPNLRALIKKYTEQHSITEAEVEQVYNHILMEML
jgi:hypothetical protein